MARRRRPDRQFAAVIGGVIGVLAIISALADQSRAAFNFGGAPLLDRACGRGDKIDDAREGGVRLCENHAIMHRGGNASAIAQSRKYRPTISMNRQYSSK